MSAPQATGAVRPWHWDGLRWITRCLPGRAGPSHSRCPGPRLTNPAAEARAAPGGCGRRGLPSAGVRQGLGTARGPGHGGRAWRSWDFLSGKDSGPALREPIITALGVSEKDSKLPEHSGSQCLLQSELLTGPTTEDTPLLAHAQAPHGSRGPGLRLWMLHPAVASSTASSTLPASRSEMQISPFRLPPRQGPRGVLPRNGSRAETLTKAWAMEVGAGPRAQAGRRPLGATVATLGGGTWHLGPQHLGRSSIRRLPPSPH